MIPRFAGISILALTTAALFTPALQAQQDNPSDFASFRQMIEKQGTQIDKQSTQLERQSKLIDNLTLEVERLRKAMEPGQRVPSATPVAPVALNSPAADAEFAVPAAQPISPPTANTHIVVKGESLDSIAKLHKTTIGDLQKLNKISDPKKLQIGQTLQVPSNSEHKSGQ